MPDPEYSTTYIRHSWRTIEQDLWANENLAAIGRGRAMKSSSSPRVGAMLRNSSYQRRSTSSLSSRSRSPPLWIPEETFSDPFKPDAKLVLCCQVHASVFHERVASRRSLNFEMDTEDVESDYEYSLRYRRDRHADHNEQSYSCHDESPEEIFTLEL